VNDVTLTLNYVMLEIPIKYSFATQRKFILCLNQK